jgi:alpha-glucosidase
LTRAVLLALALTPATLHAAEPPQAILTSPNAQIRAQIFADPQTGLSYQITWRGKPRAAPAHIGLRLQTESTVTELGAHPTLGDPVPGSIDETYPFLGAKSQATNRANTLSIPITEPNGVHYIVEARAYNDGFAWRILLDAPPRQTTRILAETSTFTLPEGEAWFGERNNAWKLKSYAGEFHHIPVDRLPTISPQGPIQIAPIIVEMTNHRGYTLITEAALANFSGMRLRALPSRTLQVDFTEGPTGFLVQGPIATPWRVTMLCPDLNCLVNSTLTENLNPPPDPALFPDTTYIRPGRAVWRFMSRQTGTPEQEQQFVDYAAALGYEYTIVDDGWKLWAAPWPSITTLCTYARTKHVGVFAWKDANDLLDPANDYAPLRDFLNHAAQSGLAGVKIDFINGESKAKIDFERRALRLAAERRLMVDFHGIQKPTGEERTFPNGLSREGVRGIELNHMAEGPIPASHNAALPFTRMAIGPADYTPLNLTWPGPTTWTHQLATAILLSAPILCIAEDPEFLLKNPDATPVLPIIRRLPAVWDETIVLPVSRIGGLAALARRSGRTWFLAAINGAAASAPIPALPPNLHLAGYRLTLVTSPAKRAFQVDHPTSWPTGRLLAPGDGIVLLLEPAQPTP